jgi:hypothetical protein
VAGECLSINWTTLTLTVAKNVESKSYENGKLATLENNRMAVMIKAGSIYLRCRYDAEHYSLTLLLLLLLFCKRLNIDQLK